MFRFGPNLKLKCWHKPKLNNTFSLKRNCFFGKIKSLIPDFEHLNSEHKLLAILCPSDAGIAVCVSKYLKIITETRKKLDQGLSNTMLETYCKY